MKLRARSGAPPRSAAPVHRLSFFVSFLFFLLLVPAATEAVATVGLHDLTPVCFLEYLTSAHAVVRGHVRHNGEMHTPEQHRRIEAFLDQTKNENLNRGRVSTTARDAQGVEEGLVHMNTNNDGHFRVPDNFLFVVTISPHPSSGITENRIAAEQQRQFLSYSNYLAEEKSRAALLAGTASQAAHKLKTFHRKHKSEAAAEDEVLLKERLERHLKRKLNQGLPFQFDIPRDLQNGEYLICVRMANPNYLLTSAQHVVPGDAAAPIAMDPDRNVFFDISIEDQMRAGTEAERLQRQQEAQEDAQQKQKQKQNNKEEEGEDTLRMNVDGLQVFRFRDTDGQFKEILQTPEYLHHLWSSLAAQHGRVLEITAAEDLLHKQEAAMRATTESTFTRVWVCGVVLVGVTGAVVYFEFHFLKRTIKKRKLI